MIAVLIIAVVNLLLLGVLWFQQKGQTTPDLKTPFTQLEKNLERVERLLREEIAANRGEQLRGLQGFSKVLGDQITVLTQMNEQKLDQLREAVEAQLRRMQEDNAQKLEKMRETVLCSASRGTTRAALAI